MVQAVSIEDAFGRSQEYTWDSLRKYTVWHVHNRFPRTSPDDIDDAVSEAMVKLVDYWAGLPSSLTDDYHRNWAYARLYCGRYAIHMLIREFRRDHPYSLDERAEGTSRSWREVLEQRPAEEAQSDADYQLMLGEFIATIPDEDILRLSGAESERQEVKRTGVKRTTVQRRRSACRRELAVRAHALGLRVTPW